MPTLVSVLMVFVKLIVSKERERQVEDENSKGAVFFHLRTFIFRSFAAMSLTNITVRTPTAGTIIDKPYQQEATKL